MPRVMLSTITHSPGPVIHIFGQSDSEERTTTCLSVAHVYPYIYIPCEFTPTPSRVAEFSLNLVNALEAILGERDRVRKRYIKAVILVKGVPFYGFHIGPSYFFKIAFFVPGIKAKLIGLLWSGKVLGHKWQPYESHIPYILQFMIDHNLFGCDWVYFEADDQTHEDNRISRCDEEWAIEPWDILNRKDMPPRNIHKDFEADREEDRKEGDILVPSLRNYWQDENRRRELRGEPPLASETTFTSTSSHGRGEQDWYTLKKLRSILDDRMRSGFEPNITMDNYVDKHRASVESEDAIMWAYESVEAFWPPHKWLFRPYFEDSLLTKNESQIDDEVPHHTEFLDEDNENQDYENEQKTFLPVFDLDLELRKDFQEHDVEPPPVPSQYHPSTPSKRKIESLDHSDITPQSQKISRPNPFATPGSSSRLPSTPNITSSQRTSLKTSSKFIFQQLPGADDSDSENSAGSPTQIATIKIRPREIDPIVSQAVDQDHEETSRPSSPCPVIPLMTQVVEGVRFVGSCTPSPVKKSANSSQKVFYVSSAESKSGKKKIFVYGPRPPPLSEVLSTISPEVIHQAVYFSNVTDVPSRPRSYAEPKPSGRRAKARKWEGRLWELSGSLPSRMKMIDWAADCMDVEDSSAKASKPDLLGPTQFPLTVVNIQGGSAESLGTTILSVEIHVNCRRSPKTLQYLKADPQHDSIQAIAYSFYCSDSDVSQPLSRSSYRNGVIVVSNEKELLGEHMQQDSKIIIVDEELELLNTLIDLTRELDPDCVTGWEIERSSWGYIQARAAEYSYALNTEISRLRKPPTRFEGSRQYSATSNTTFQVVGREVLNLWRIMRGELALTSYTFESVVFKTLRVRTPFYSDETLSRWYQSGNSKFVNKVLAYVNGRSRMNLEIIEVTEYVSRNSEFARCFGVDFNAVIRRGSQFKVESFMMRMAKPENFLLVSPNTSQVGTQNAAECIALVMEPQSTLYVDPVLVLDFQSLYPSIMIGYNYSYDTCLGRVEPYKGADKLGFTRYTIDPALLAILGDSVNISPNGLVFLKPHIRQGVVRKVLAEILDTRVMIKEAMKLAKEDKSLYRILNARQLSLKFVANVTYGYIGASFSGRMPCVEIADAIVQTGRETLEKAITLIQGNTAWAAEVVYGDTDSLFVHLPGRSKVEAFRIGQEISEAVTVSNPRPLNLKFEKVYHPCVLIAKKRYVGFKYEHVNEQEPTFDAKGIETVRRDGSGIERKSLELTLKKLFRTKDLSLIKKYCTDEFSKIMLGDVSLQDCIIAKEVKLGTYSTIRAPPTGAMVAAELMMDDKRAEPEYADRIPYIITSRELGDTQAHTSVHPKNFLADSSSMINSDYYCSRMVMVLGRILNLVGADIDLWLQQMPKPARNTRTVLRHVQTTKASVVGRKINFHFKSSACYICETKSKDVICEECSAPANRQVSIGKLMYEIRNVQLEVQQLHRICGSCSETSPMEKVCCESLDCPVMYNRVKADRKLFGLVGIDKLLADLNISAEKPPIEIM